LRIEALDRAFVNVCSLLIVTTALYFGCNVPYIFCGRGGREDLYFGRTDVLRVSVLVGCQ